MSMTFAMIKPDAVRAGNAGNIIQRINDNGFAIRAMKLIHMTKPIAEGFYAVHRERPFFKALVEFMVSGPVMIQVLEGMDAVTKNRDLMGATNPKEAARGTIRADFAESIDANAVHGSDAVDTAKSEIAYFFSSIELCSKA